MNERIQELIDHANLTEVIDDAYQQRNDWQPFVEKFAELIVKECANIVWDEADKTNNPDVNNAAYKIINYFFGVEEQPVCKHDWYSAKNPVVQNGSVCVICGAIDAREPEELNYD